MPKIHSSIEFSDFFHTKHSRLDGCFSSLEVEKGERTQLLAVVENNLVKFRRQSRVLSLARRPKEVGSLIPDSLIHDEVAAVVPGHDIVQICAKGGTIISAGLVKFSTG